MQPVATVGSLSPPLELLQAPGPLPAPHGLSPVEPSKPTTSCRALCGLRRQNVPPKPQHGGDSTQSLATGHSPALTWAPSRFSRQACPQRTPSPRQAPASEGQGPRRLAEPRPEPLQAWLVEEAARDGAELQRSRISTHARALSHVNLMVYKDREWCLGHTGTAAAGLPWRGLPGPSHHLMPGKGEEA